MKRTFAVTFFIVGIFMQFPASATMTGLDLRDYCNAEKGTQKFQVCLAYIVGVMDSYANKALVKADFFCVPEVIKGEQIQLIAQKYLDSHPEQLHYVASSLLVEALGETFPCK